MPFTAWRRVTVGASCPFCLMLATRGAVYKSETTAGQDNKYHRHCDCRVELETDPANADEVAIDPQDANRVIEFRKGGKTYQYDLTEFTGQGVTAPPRIPAQPRVTAPRPKPKVPSQTDAKAQAQAAISRRLAKRGETLVSAKPGGKEFAFPKGWQRAAGDQAADWEPGDMLALVTNGRLNVIDVDVAKGASIDAVRGFLASQGVRIVGVVKTPSGGRHFYVSASGIRSSATRNMDFRGASADGQGTGLVYLPGTKRPAYDGGGYEWEHQVDWALLDNLDTDDQAQRLAKALDAMGFSVRK